MSEQKFYNAADAYTLADVYKPKKVETYRGRGFALFAAGEYMSSAFFLRQAVLLDKKKALERVEIIPLIGDRDMFDMRLEDAGKWLNASRAPELSYMLAFILYNTHMLEQAQESIQFAVDNMGDDDAVMILKNAIDEEVKRQTSW